MATKPEEEVAPATEIVAEKKKPKAKKVAVADSESVVMPVENEIVAE